MKSPLRYPGGKSRYIKQILPHIPADKVLASPFFGGGHIEIACANRGQLVRGCDAFAPLANFWFWMMAKPRTVFHIVQWFHKQPKNYEALFLDGRKIVIDRDDEEAAAYYFLINRCSFSGATLSGGFSWEAATKRFTESSIQRLGELNLSRVNGVHCKDFSEFIPCLTKRHFIYADPPYYQVRIVRQKRGYEL